MAAKLKAVTAVICIAVIIGAGAYYVRWYSAQRDAGQPPSNDPLYSAYDRLPARGPAGQPDPNGFAPEDVVRRHPPITKVEVVSRETADKWLQNNELVIGVVIDGKPRAYVINTMTGPHREIFNDTLAGRPIAATW